MKSSFNLLTIYQLQNMKSNTAEDRSPHARFGRGLGLEGWPRPRSKRSLANIKTVVVADPLECPSPTGRRMLPAAHLALKKETATLNKRKASVADLGLGPMTTVQEGCLDSRRLLRLSRPGKTTDTTQQRYLDIIHSA